MWSLQYIFMRVAVPVFGIAVVAEGRALFAALFLLPWVAWVARQRIGLREHWRDHLTIALVNNVAPFVCFAWAATQLPAGYLAVINGMVPLWTALIAVPVLKEPLGAKRIAGFALGVAGVALIVNLGPVELSWKTALAAVVGIAGAAFWGWAGVLIKQRSGRVPPMSLAAGSIAFSALLMMPLVGCHAAARGLDDERDAGADRAGRGVQRRRLPALLHPDPRHRPFAHADRRPRRAGARHPLGVAVPGRDGDARHAGRDGARSGCARANAAPIAFRS